MGRIASRKRQTLLSLGALAVTLAMAELVSFAGISMVSGRLDEPIRTRRMLFVEQSRLIGQLLVDQPDRLLTLHPTLGWTYRAGYAARDTTNTWGARGIREYVPAAPPPGVLRIGAFGDSFVYGSEVGAGAVWSSVWERRDSSVEVVNFGVGGYGVDQALLRHGLEKHRLAADVVLMGFAPPDMGRLVSVYRRFHSGNDLPLMKPRFRLQPDGELVLVPPPAADSTSYAAILERPELVREFGQHDYWYEPLIYANPFHDRLASMRLASAVWNRLSHRYFSPQRLESRGSFRPQTEAFRIQLAVFQAFADSVRTTGALPILVFLPDRGSTMAAIAGQHHIYKNLVDSVAARGLTAIDAVEAMRKRSSHEIPKLFMPGGHYSELGNAIVAEWLNGRLPDVLKTLCLDTRPGNTACPKIRGWLADRL